MKLGKKITSCGEAVTSCCTGFGSLFSWKRGSAKPASETQHLVSPAIDVDYNSLKTQRNTSSSRPGSKRSGQNPAESIENNLGVAMNEAATL